MNRYMYLLFSLAIPFVAAQAQSNTALNTVGPSAELVAAGKAPRKANAIEAPFYIKIYGFYGLLTPGSQVASNLSSNPPGTAAGSTSFKIISTGLGAGPRAGIGVGTIVSDFINLGIDAEILYGAELKTDNNTVGSSNSYVYTSNITTTLKVLSIIPNITFKALSRPAYYIYNRLGIVGGIVLDYKTVQSGLYVPTTGARIVTEYISDYTENSLSIGYQAALGIQFRLSQNLRGFAEVVAYNQSFKPKKLQYSTTNAAQGTVVAPVVTTTEYKDEGVVVNSGQNLVRQSYNVAMNSVGLGAGILFRF